MDNIPSADYHIVGASFAGAMLAIRLARYGSVVILDRAIPGTRLKCGGGLPIELLEGLGVDIPFVPIRRVILSMRGKDRDFPLNYATVDRARLDHALFQKAIAAGVRFVRAEFVRNDVRGSQATASIDGQVQKFSYRKLILAFGFRPSFSYSFGERLKSPMPYGLAVVEKVKQKTPYPESLFIEVPDELSLGYNWIFPMPGDSLNIGLGSLHEKKITSQLLQAFKTRMGIDGTVEKKGGGLLPMGPASVVMKGNTILFGDAAGMIYPLNGEGLSHIADLADVWADGIHAGENLDKIWRSSRTYGKLRFGARALKIILAGGSIRLPIYRWSILFSAWARSRNFKLPRLGRTETK